MVIYTCDTIAVDGEPWKYIKIQNKVQVKPYEDIRVTLETRRPLFLGRRTDRQLMRYAIIEESSMERDDKIHVNVDICKWKKKAWPCMWMARG